MPDSTAQQILRDPDKKLWSAAGRLRANLDAAVYKHAVLVPVGYMTPAAYANAIRAELEERDYYLEKNVFWVPALARWKTLQDSAKLPAGSVIEVIFHLRHQRPTSHRPLFSRAATVPPISRKRSHIHSGLNTHGDEQLYPYRGSHLPARLDRKRLAETGAT